MARMLNGMTTRVLLVRHGETDWNADGRWQGHAPVPLNASGLAQSRALGRYLAANGYAVEALYSSDLTRAMQTATALGEALGLPVQPERRLREIDLGEWQGMTRDEAAAWDAQRYAAYSADWRGTPVPGGESRRQVQVRARAVFDDLAVRHSEDTIAIVTHGGTLGMLIESLFGVIERPSLANTSITLLERPDGGADWRLVKVSWTPHLKRGGARGETW